jgi:hypothetical protein
VRGAACCDRASRRLRLGARRARDTPAARVGIVLAYSAYSEAAFAAALPQMRQLAPSFTCFGLLAAVAAVAAATTSPPRLAYHSGGVDGADFLLTLGGEVIAASAPLVVHANGARYSSADGSLKRSAKVPTTSRGTDSFGAFAEVRTTWAAGVTALEAAVRTYDDCLVFELHWPQGANGTSGGALDEGGGETGVVAGWPSLQLLGAGDRGFLAFGGRQLEDCFAAPLSELSQLPAGDGGGGPLAIFDRNGSTVVLSAASEFMSAAWSRVPRGNATLSSGTLGTVTSLPAGFRSLTILMGAAGPTSGVVGVGRKLQSVYHKNASESRSADRTLSTLGWSTDNGAYFYGKPEAAKNFEQTLLDMHSYSKQAKLPISYALLDSCECDEHPASARPTRLISF